MTLNNRPIGPAKACLPRAVTSDDRQCSRHCTPVRASIDDIAINGRYKALSLGNWAKTNDALHHRPTIVSTWTISSLYSTAHGCTGQVSCDQGWSARLYLHDGVL